MTPTDTAATEPVSGSPFSAPRSCEVGAGVGERDVGAGDRGGAGAAVGLQHVAVEHDGVLAERLVVDDRAQGPADEPGDLVGAATDAALDRLAVGAGVGRGGEHGVLRGDPAQPGALAPARHALARRRCAQHAGAAELDQHRAGCVVEPVAGDGHGAELVVGSSVGAGHGGEPRPQSQSRPSGGEGSNVCSDGSGGTGGMVYVVPVAATSIGPSKTSRASSRAWLRVVPRRHVGEHQPGGLRPRPRPRRPACRSGAGRPGCHRSPRTPPRRAAGRHPAARSTSCWQGPVSPEYTSSAPSASTRKP